MKLIAVTQRTGEIGPQRERRDQLDIAWSSFLHDCGLLPLIVPNHPAQARALVERAGAEGLLLTGGDDPGVTPARDATERALIDWAMATRRPILGVCRGMQMLGLHFGAELVPVEGHVAVRHPIDGPGGAQIVNSFHNFGFRALPGPLQATARAADGSIEAAEHAAAPVRAVMWHPERETPFSADDIALFVRHFNPEAH